MFKLVDELAVGIGLKWLSVDSIFYRLQRSCGQGYVYTRVCDSVNRGEGLWRTPPDQGDPPPRDEAHPPRTKENPPPGRTLQHTVNERPVRILLECILVWSNSCCIYSILLVEIGVVDEELLSKFCDEWRQNKDFRSSRNFLPVK